MLPRDLVKMLRQRGHEAIHVHQIAVIGTSDKGIWSYAEDTLSVLISKDSDFEHFAAISNRAHLIHYKKGNQTTAELLGDILQELENIEEKIKSGNRIIVVAPTESI